MTFSELIDSIHTTVIAAISSLPNDVIVSAMIATLPIGFLIGSHALYLNRKALDNCRVPD